MPLTLGHAWNLFDSLTPALASVPMDDLALSGDARRHEPFVSSLILAAHAPDPEAAIAAVAQAPTAAEIVERTTRRVLFTYQGVAIDLRVAPPEAYGSVLFNTTGATSHVAAVLQRGGPTLCATESAIYAQAGLPFIPAEVRNGGGEIEIAAAGGLRTLVTRADIRGDLHMHTTASDGRDSLDRMLTACRRIGHEYIAITDHSVSAPASRTMTADRLRRQADEVARARADFPGLTILHGVEVDVLPDGRLDFPDAVLAPLDIVLASLHDRAGQDGRQLTERCLSAIRHPLVSIITHPSNQLVGRRPGYDLDYARLYEAAAETGTVLEIDGAPSHLDLDGNRAREAVRAGVMVAIDSDCHDAGLLERQMGLGIGTARRGWVEPRHVLNAGTLDEMRAFLSRKRASA